jgi:hypothetical protein
MDWQEPLTATKRDERLAALEAEIRGIEYRLQGGPPHHLDDELKSSEEIEKRHEKWRRDHERALALAREQAKALRRLKCVSEEEFNEHLRRTSMPGAFGSTRNGD